MNVKRRDFLKIAGVSAIAGIGIPSALNMLLKGEAKATAEAEHQAAPAAHGGGHEAASTAVQLGMVINVKKFGEIKGLAEKCIEACHTTHNVPEFNNPKDAVKWVWIEDFEHLFTQQNRFAEHNALPFLTLCNHCANPLCVRACPTQATFKAPNGNVIMDYHRCIGCRFCMAACPYGARSFNWRDPREKDAGGNLKFIKKLNLDYPTRMRGVVEKCNFCAERVDKNLPPACVEACGDTKALIFGNLNDSNSEIAQVLKTTFTSQRKQELGTKPSLFYII